MCKSMYNILKYQRFLEKNIVQIILDRNICTSIGISKNRSLHIS